MLGSIAKVKRFAGPALQKVAKFLGPKNLLTVTDDKTGLIRTMGPLEMAFRLGPDAGFALLNAIQTPGDLGDKLAVGGTQFLMETGLGLSAGKLAKNQQLSGLLDMGGSIVGGYGSMPVSDMLLRGKDKLTGGQGLTPYEKLSLAQQQELAQQIEQQVLQAYGISSLGRYVDPTTGMGVA